jgi:hypothetical protein
MPQKDIYHDIVKRALVKDGWTITHDPFTISVGRRNLFADLGAQSLVAAEKKTRKIAVEIKSFVGHSEVNDMQNAVGQYILCQRLMAQDEPNRVLYLAIRDSVHEGIFSEPLGQILLAPGDIRLLIFNVQDEVIVKWIPR